MGMAVEDREVGDLLMGRNPYNSIALYTPYAQL